MREEFVYGRNPVTELLRMDGRVKKLFVQNSELKGSIKEIMGIAKDKGIVVNFVDQKKLDELSNNGRHQGVVAIVNDYKYYELDEVFESIDRSGEDAFIVVCDEIEDPHNLGAIIRSAECAGAHAVIIPKRRSALVNETVFKSSAGACEHMKVVMVTNIRQAIGELKERGLWIFGAHLKGGNYHYNTDMSGKVALVIGNEGRGLSKHVAEDCDVLVRIPQFGKIDSLNASVAAGILIYEVVRQRHGKEAK